MSDIEPHFEPEQTQAHEPPSRVAPRLLLVGDSITQYGEEVEGENAPGWVARLRHRVGVCMHVINYSRSGYNSELGKRLLLRALIIEPTPSAIIIFFGANDAAVAPSPQSIPLAQYKRNLKAMIRTIRSHSPTTTPILITPPPIDDNVRGPDRRFERTKLYAEACVRVAIELGVVYVDLHSAMIRGIADCLCDGLHLSKIGNKFVEVAVVGALERQVSHCSPSRLLHSFKKWDEIDDVDACIGPGIAS